MDERKIKDLLLRELDLPILEELSVCNGRVRADLVAITSQLHCYEIKSERDNLSRLMKQGFQYNRFFHYVTLVCAEQHAEAALNIIPDWWGLSTVDCESTNEQRAPTKNPAVDPIALAEIFSRAELETLLKSHNFENRLTGTPIGELRRWLAEKLNLEELGYAVKNTLVGRITKQDLDLLISRE